MVRNDRYFYNCLGQRSASQFCMMRLGDNQYIIERRFNMPIQIYDDLTAIPDLKLNADLVLEIESLKQQKKISITRHP